MGWTTAATAATAWRPPEPEGDEFKNFPSFNDDILIVNQRTLSSINVYSRLFVDDGSLRGTCRTRIA